MSNQKFPDKAGVIIFPPLLYLLALGAGLFLSHFFPYHLFSPAIALISGGIIIALAFLVIRMAAKSMIKHETTIHPRGVTTTIVKEGIYQFTRNPMYVSFTLFYIGISVMCNAWAGMILLVPLLSIVQKGIIKREEKYLTRKFGTGYLFYKEKVRRWL